MPAEDSESRAQLELTYQWLPPEALSTYLDLYFKIGTFSGAWVELRADPRYESWFPGNITEDGRPRYSEEMYANVVGQYDSIMEGVGLGDTLQHRYGEWIAGDVTPSEAEGRIVPMYERIVSQSQQLKQWYAENYGIAMTDRALLLSALDPAVGEQILTKQISIAEIGGEGLESGFNVDEVLATRMFEEQEMTRGEAESVFQRAESFVPVLSMLANRHGDPDDDFDLQEFVSADVFADPEQRRRMSRLLAQEKSLFTGGAQIEFTLNRAGGLSGLESV